MLGFAAAPSQKVVLAVLKEEPEAPVEKVIKLALKRYIGGIPHPITVYHCGCRTEFGKLASNIFYHNGNKDKTISPQRT